MLVAKYGKGLLNAKGLVEADEQRRSKHNV